MKPLQIPKFSRELEKISPFLEPWWQYVCEKIEKNQRAAPFFKDKESKISKKIKMTLFGDTLVLMEKSRFVDLPKK